jgi:hypothetical protein
LRIEQDASLSRSRIQKTCTIGPREGVGARGVC